MKVLIVAPAMIPSTILCGHSQMEYLHSINAVEYQFTASHSINEKQLNWADIIIYIRSDSELDVIISSICKKANKRQVYVLDDDLLNMPEGLGSSPHYNSSEVKDNIISIISNCDVFLSPSPNLVDKYGNKCRYAFKIDEPSIYHHPKTRKKQSQTVKIGFAGSTDRTQDISVILEEALRKTYQRYGNRVEIEFMGAKPQIVDELGLKHIPYQDSYEKYITTMNEAGWDIGLAPMPKTEFHSCKYFNKYVEYSSFGIVGIYSNCEPYTFGVKDRETGMLVDNTPEQWFSAISEMIENQPLREKIRENEALERIHKYSLEKLSPEYLEDISFEYHFNSKPISLKMLRLYKTITIGKRVWRKVKEEKYHFPVWLVNKVYSFIKSKNQ